MRRSAAATITFLAEPAWTASMAAFMALLAPLREWAISMVSISSRRSVAALIMLADCFSTYGGESVAKYSPSTCWRSMPFKQSKTASTPMVRLSSSALATAFSPLASDLVHIAPISSRLSL